MVWNLRALSTSNPGVDFDKVTVGSNLTLGGGSSLALDFSTLPSGDPNSGDPFWSTSHHWQIVDAATNAGSTNFASLSNATFGLGHFTTTVVQAVPGDANNDGIVNGLDINLVASHWLQAGGSPLGDANADNVVNGLDINLMATNWLHKGSDRRHPA